MIRKILLVSEAPESYDQLLRSLAAAGFQVLSQTTLGAAVSVLRDAESAASAMVLDGPAFSAGDAEALAGLSVQHPLVRMLVFVSRGLQEETLNRLKSFRQISIHSVPLGDRTSPGLILKEVTEAIASGASSDATLTEATVQGDRSATFERGERPEQGLTSRSEARDPLYADEFLRRVGRSDVPVLLHGETGAGKEVMARKLWAYSNRVGKPFLKLNCAALPSELIESELFGYEKGAFTGAMVDKPGKFELAQDGTILLDEIGDMDTRLQAKLLQVLQDGEIQPLGSSRVINVNVRIMAATHRDLHAAIAQGTFRDDLYYRLGVINITIPPLRERRDEIIPLAEKLLLRHVGPGCSAPMIPEMLKRAMLAHSWPGNVRELENVMRRFLVYQDASLLAAELTEASDPPKLRLALTKAPASSRPPLNGGRVSFDHFAEISRTAESKLLLETLESVRWNRRQAALQLNIDYKALLYKLQKHGIVESKAKRREVSA
jgi:transcriptional regulator with PAS, ATPase and Fis domain